jgi:hypothetical protein
MEVITRLILEVHKKSHDRYSKNNIHSASSCAVDRVCKSFSANRNQRARGVCHIHPAANKTGIDIANACATDDYANVGSICSYADSILQRWGALR